MARKLSRLDVTMNGLMSSITKLVAEWKPKECARETQYSAALAEYLRDACPPGTRVETEYRDGGTTADVWLSWQGLMVSSQIFFEVKRNLEKKTDYDRLVGQIVSLKPGERRVMVILIGETRQDLTGRLREHFHKELDEDEQKMRIIAIKPVASG